MYLDILYIVPTELDTRVFKVQFLTSIVLESYGTDYTIRIYLN